MCHSRLLRDDDRTPTKPPAWTINKDVPLSSQYRRAVEWAFSMNWLELKIRDSYWAQTVNQPFNALNLVMFSARSALPFCLIISSRLRFRLGNDDSIRLMMARA